ncbi:MAG: hypothetical protein GC168_07230 [Candidatus Hydrogenedens sp.]|nr:hypothetical protein [Candidatus Hydrogenedens sp.]
MQSSCNRIRDFVAVVACVLSAMLPAATGNAAPIPRILYVGDSWTYFPWAEQDPPALRSVLGRNDVKQAVGGEFTEVGDIALHSPTAEGWDTPGLKDEITSMLNAYPTIDVVHISLGGNDVNINWTIGMSEGDTNALLAATRDHIRNVIQHCLSVRPNIRCVINGYDYLNIAEGYTYDTWTNPFNPFDIVTYVKSIENPTAIALVAFGIHVPIFNPDLFQFDYTTAAQIAGYQRQVNDVFVELERLKKDLALGMDRVRYVHNFGTMMARFGIPSLNVGANPGWLPDGPGGGYANFPGGDRGLWSPRQAMAGSNELDPIHLSPQGYIYLMENAVYQAYIPWFSDPVPPRCESITLGSADPPVDSTVSFNVRFTEGVTGVDAGDFAIDEKGTAAGAAILSVSGSGRDWVVTTSVSTGDGSLSIDFIDNDSVYDGVWNPLGGLGADDFIQGAWYTIGTGEGGGGDLDSDCPLLPGIDGQGQPLYLLFGDFWELKDFDGNGMIDSWEIAPLAEVLCRPSHPLYPQLRGQYEATLNLLKTEPAYSTQLRSSENVLAALLLVNPSVNSMIKNKLSAYLTRPYQPFTIDLLGQFIQPFSPAADIDGDSYNNKAEYDAVLSNFGNRDAYVDAVLTAACPEGILRGVEFARSIEYLYTKTITIPLTDPICLLCEDSYATDLDENGIVDYAQALLIDAVLWCADNPHYLEVGSAYLNNEVVVKGYLDELWDKLSQQYYGLPVEQGIGLVIDVGKVQRALVGLVTQGEPAGVAAMLAIFSELNTLLDEDKQIEVDATLFDTSAAPYVGALGDADDDGVCNLSEFNAVPRDLGGYVSFVANAMNPDVLANGGGCDGEENNNGEEPADCSGFLALLDAEGSALYAAIPGSDGWATEDLDANGIADCWEAALLAGATCAPDFAHYLGARKKYTGNLSRLQGDAQFKLIQEFQHVLAALMTVSQAHAEYFSKLLQLSGYYYPYRDSAPGGRQQLASGGDPDGDEMTNLFERNYVAGKGGTRADYVAAAMTPLGGNVDRCFDQCGPDGSGPCGPVDFDGKMAAVDRALEQFRSQLGGYSFDPSSSDINGGFSIEDEQIFPNGLLDSDEFALINYFLTQGGLGASQQVCEGWNNNKARMYADLGGPTGLVNAISPQLHEVLAAYMLLGDDDSVAIPVTATTEAAAVTDIDLGVTAVNPSNYTRLPALLAFNGDADNDGVSNADEYSCFRLRSRCCYLLAATDALLQPGPGLCIDPGDAEGEGEAAVEGAVDGEGKPEGAVDGEGATEGGGEGEPSCEIEGCDRDCAYAEGIDAGFEAAMRTIYANPLVGEDPDTADLDENGIPDTLHARLVDAVLADPDYHAYCCVRSAYETNLPLANEFATAVNTQQPLLFTLFPRATVVNAIAGLMTLGEEATIAIIVDALDSLPFSLPDLDLNDFDRTSERFLAWNGDADLDGACNLGEYNASLMAASPLPQFVPWALNADATANGGGCPCGGGTLEGEGHPAEGEGSVEGEEGETTLEGESAAEGEPQQHRHSADLDGNGKIDLAELLRLIQFYNAGGLHCSSGSEDAYAPGAGAKDGCAPHAADFQVQDWVIQLSELLRVVQFFNRGTIRWCGESEDGFCF